MPDHQPLFQDPAFQLNRDLYQITAQRLRATLPDPLIDTDEERARRDRAAIATVASLSPACADEALLAAQYVAAHIRAMDYLRQLQEAAEDPPRVKQLNAQAACMMREARGARSLLLRVQAERHKREADHAACDQDAWSAHIALTLMTEGLGHPQATATPPQPAPAPESPQAPPPPEPTTNQQPAHQAQSPQAQAAAPPPGPAEPPPPAPVAAKPPQAADTPPTKTPPDPEPDPIAEAEAYAILYPSRARLIRKCGGVPEDCDFGPPEPALAHTIATSTSPILRALDATAA
jgi:hypothetical protein